MFDAMPPDSTLFDPSAMTQSLRLALPTFTHVGWTASTASTNADLLDMNRTSSLARPWLQGAHLQTQGRGRVGRLWQNQPGACLMFSCAFDVSLPPEQLPMLSPMSGVAACMALRTLLAPERQGDLTLKWPNDVQWRDAKLAGILVETARAASTLPATAVSASAQIPAQKTSTHGYVVVMGIGINLRDAQALSLALGRNVADWSQILRGHVNAVQLVTTIVQHWEADIRHLHAQGADDFARQYAPVDALAGKSVSILNQGAVVLSGIAKGVNARGQLLVRTHGKDVAVTVGEVSVRTA